MIRMTRRAFSAGFAARTSAAMPAICGVAIEVPDR